MSKNYSSKCSTCCSVLTRSFSLADPMDPEEGTKPDRGEGRTPTTLTPTTPFPFPLPLLFPFTALAARNKYDDNKWKIMVGEKRVKIMTVLRI